MKTAEVKKLDHKAEFPPMEELSKLMDRIDPVRIDVINWKEFSYKPEVSLAIAYSGNEIFLKYYVKENYFKAEKTQSNDNVYEDSCVEFFVSPADDGIYYNFEFNGIGTCLLGCGTGRADSKRVDPEIISRIRRLSSLGNKPVGSREGEISWTLTVAISLKVFFRHNINDLRGKTLRANFYKCGDMLKVPHYVSWSPIGTEKPDYHRPEYFGELKFI